MKQTQKFVLYGLAALLALAVVARMMTSAPASTEDADANTEVLVSQLIENDPLIAPLRPR
jgi:bacteriorhodopsin